MSAARFADSKALLASLRCRGSYLDVGCGHGEMLRSALAFGFLSARGTEIVPELCDGATVVEAWIQDLPFSEKAFDVVSAFDVLEHLQFGDIEHAVGELFRVAKQHVLISTSNKSSQAVKGEELHATRWPFEAWDAIFRRAAGPHRVEWLKQDRPYGGQFWRADLC